MKKAIKRIAQKSNRKLQDMMGRMEVNLMLPIAEILVATQWHIEQLAGAAATLLFRDSRSLSIKWRNSMPDTAPARCTRTCPTRCGTASARSKSSSKSTCQPRMQRSKPLHAPCSSHCR